METYLQGSRGASMSGEATSTFVNIGDSAAAAEEKAAPPAAPPPPASATPAAPPPPASAPPAAPPPPASAPPAAPPPPAFAPPAAPPPPASAPPAAPPPPAFASRAAPFSVFMSKRRAQGEWKRGLSCFDFLVRVFAVGACMAAAIIMGTTEETLPFFTQLFQFHAKFDDLPAFTFFVIGNAIAGGYLLLSIPFSLIGVVRPRAVGLRLLLLIFDTVMVALTAASAASAAAIVYLAHTGNAKANWVEICRQFNNFCQQTSGAVVASFVATVLLMVLVIMSALALRKD